MALRTAAPPAVVRTGSRQHTACSAQGCACVLQQGAEPHIGEHGTVQDDPHEGRDPEGGRPRGDGADEPQQVAEEGLRTTQQRLLYSLLFCFVVKKYFLKVGCHLAFIISRGTAADRRPHTAGQQG